jgi:hypothetical protein
MRLFTLPLVCLLVLMAHGQNGKISGTVTDKLDKQALIGVNVVYAPGKGVVTDVNGRYTLELPTGEYVLTCSYV